MVFFDDVHVWGTRAQAVASGLFGPFADERLLLVALDDVATLQRIHDMDGQPGALRVGHRGFMRWLIKGSRARQNQIQLETLWRARRAFWGQPQPPPPQGQGQGHQGDDGDGDGDGEDPVLASMPTFKHVVLFRFCEE